SLERVLATMMARHPQDRFQTPADVAKALEPHTHDERQALPVAMTLSARSIGPVPQAPFFASSQGEARRQPRWRVIIPLWLALVGALVASVALVGVMILAAMDDGGSSKKDHTPNANGQAKAGTDGTDSTKGKSQGKGTAGHPLNKKTNPVAT